MKKYLFIVVCIFLLQTILSGQCQLVNAGPDEMDQASFRHVIVYSSAMAPNSEQYVAAAYSSNGSFPISVKKFSSNGWSFVGTPQIPNTYNPTKLSICITSNNLPILAFSTPTAPFPNNNGHKFSVCKFNGSTWSYLNDPVVSSGNGSGFSFALDNSDTPYLAFADGSATNRLSVLKYNGTSWVNVGVPDFSPDPINFSKILFGSNNTPYVIFNDISNRLTVMKFDGSNWVYVGSPMFSIQTQLADMKIGANDNLYVACSATFVYNRVYSYEYNGVTWSQLAPPADLSTNSIVKSISLATSTSGAVYLSYIKSANAIDSLKLMHFNGTNWQLISHKKSYSGYFNGLLFCKSNNSVRASVGDFSNSKRISVFEYNGSSHTQMGNMGITSTGATEFSTCISKNGLIYTLFLDASDNFLPRVISYNGTTWNSVGTLTNFASGYKIRHLKITTDTSGLPVIVFQNYTTSNSSNFFEVRRFNGTSWINVGNSNFTSSNFSPIDLAIDKNNVPYVAFNNLNANPDITVKKFNGTNWLDVGVPNFYQGSLYPNALAIDSLGVPYITCKGQSSKVVVQKFNGNSWIDLSSNTFSNSLSKGSAIRIVGTTPYIGFIDDANNNRTFVLAKYTANNWQVIPANSSVNKLHDYYDFKVSNNDITYLVYSDLNNFFKPTLKKFDGTNWITPHTNTINTENESNVSIEIFSSNSIFITYGSGGLYALKFDNCVGVEEHDKKTKSSLLLYPNPNNGHFSIKNTDGTSFDEIEIFNALGQKVKNITTGNAGDTYEMTTSELPQGMYLLNVKNKNQLVQSTKFIKE